jgi:hypothetical protein
MLRDLHSDARLGAWMSLHRRQQLLDHAGRLPRRLRLLRVHELPVVRGGQRVRRQCSKIVHQTLDLVPVGREGILEVVLLRAERGVAVSEERPWQTCPRARD